MRSGVPRAPSRTRMRARVSSHIFLMRSPLRPMMLPTLRTGTISRNTQFPGHPGHLLSAAGAGGSDSDSGFTFDGSDSVGTVVVVVAGVSAVVVVEVEASVAVVVVVGSDGTV